MNWTQRIKESADDLKRAQVKIVSVRIGDEQSQDLVTMAGSNSLVFGQSDIEGLSGTLFDMSGETCNNGELYACLMTIFIVNNLRFNLYSGGGGVELQIRFLESPKWSSYYSAPKLQEQKVW